MLIYIVFAYILLFAAYMIFKDYEWFKDIKQVILILLIIPFVPP